MTVIVKESKEKQQEQEQPKLARDQPVGDQPEGTSLEDFQQFERKRRIERAQIDRDEGRLDANGQVRFAASLLKVDSYRK